MKFKDKVVLVTGSGKGIGKAIALEFLKEGAKVVINSRGEDNLKITRDEFLRLGYQTLMAAGDVTDPGFCEELIINTLEQYGSLDILINNAGVGFRGLIEETTPETFRKIVDSNLLSAVYCTYAALPHIIKSKGSIVFISGLAGIRGVPRIGPYCVAKMGLTALAETLRIELYGTGVHIGILMVGLTDFDEDKRVMTANGEMVPIIRKSHHTREQVAKIVIKTVWKRKFRVVLTPLGYLQSFFQRLSPAFVEWTLIRTSKSGLYK